jgi:hypothetical protein
MCQRLSDGLARAAVPQPHHSVMAPRNHHISAEGHGVYRMLMAQRLWLMPQRLSDGLARVAVPGRVEDWRLCSLGSAHPFLPVSVGSASLSEP